MKKRNQEKVYEAYEQIIDWFDTARTKTLMEANYLTMIVKALPKGGTILDLGCGTGEPIAKFFIEKGFKVTGVDGSQKMIALCQKRFPNERWIISDMRDIHLNQQFDAVLAWHSFFHLDPESQREMVKTFALHTKPGGLLVFTSGDEEGEVWGENGGEQLYHASLSAAEYHNLLTATAFDVLVHAVRDPECDEATVWVARKK